MLSDKNIIIFEKFIIGCEFIGISVMLFLAFYFQLYLKELPCPLCILQRIGFLCVALGFLMNLRFGFKPSHYAFILFSALATSFIALRQIALHVIPGTGFYGNAIFGYHLYTWSFMTSMGVAIFTILMLGIDRQYRHQASPTFTWLTKLFFMIILVLCVSNLFSLMMECGFSTCPDNPSSYRW